MPRAYDAGGETQFFDYSSALAYEKSMAGMSPRDTARAFFQQGVRGAGILQAAPTRQEFWITMQNLMMQEDVQQRPPVTYKVGAGGTMGFSVSDVIPIYGYGVSLDTYNNFETPPIVQLLKDLPTNILANSGTLAPNTIADDTPLSFHSLTIAYKATTPVLEVYNDGTLLFSYAGVLDTTYKNFGICASTGGQSQNSVIGSYLLSNYGETTTYYYKSFIGYNPIQGTDWNFYRGGGSTAPYYNVNEGTFYMLRANEENSSMMFLNPAITAGVPVGDWQITMEYATWPQGGADGIVACFLKDLPVPL